MSQPFGKASFAGTVAEFRLYLEELDARISAYNDECELVNDYNG